MIFRKEVKQLFKGRYNRFLNIYAKILKVLAFIAAGIIITGLLCKILLIFTITVSLFAYLCILIIIYTILIVAYIYLRCFKGINLNLNIDINDISIKDKELLKDLFVSIAISFMLTKTIYDNILVSINYCLIRYILIGLISIVIAALAYSLFTGLLFKIVFKK